MRQPFTRPNRLADPLHSSAGFTLTELLVAAVIGTVVISSVGAAVVAILNASQQAEARSQRQIDLSRAFDFITHETRMARAINRTETMVADGTTVTVEDVVASTGLSLTDLGAYETVVLYLEIPINAAIPATCPAGGPNAGSPPPQPAEYDRVVYDIRPNGNTWLGPRAIYRFGRIPEPDGTINPCSTPLSSDILVDAIAQTDISPAPTCDAPGVLSGAGGFFACVTGRQVNLSLQSKVSNVEVQGVNSVVSSRVVTDLVPILSGTRSPGTDIMQLSWSWSGPTTGISFILSQTVNGVSTEVYNGPNLSASSTLTGSSGANHCFTVTATEGTYITPPSEPVCVIK